MKKLEMNQMEGVEGGASDYCSTLNWWSNNNYEGYQGDILWLEVLIEVYC